MKKILVLLLVLISNLGFSQKPTDKINVNKINIELIEKLVLEEINNYRVNYSYLEKIPNTPNHYRKINDPIHKLVVRKDLINLSRLHSQKMVDLDQGLFHDTLDYEDLNFRECVTIGTLGQKTYIKLSKDIFEQWKSSPKHNQALLDTDIYIGEVGISLQQKTEIIPIFDNPIKVNDFYATFRTYIK